MQTLKSYFCLLPIAIPIILGQFAVFVFSIPSSDTHILWQTWYFVCTGLTVVFLCQWINCLTFGNTWVAILINVLLLLSYGLLVCSQLITGESLDYKLAIENLANFKYMETIEMAIDLDWRFPVQLISVLVLLIFGDIYFKVFSKTVGTKRWSKFAVGLLGYGFFVVATPQRDELTLFAKSYSYHAFGGQYRNFVMPDSLSSFPYMKVIQPVNDTISAGRPHVFIVMMESANGFFIEKKSKDGREITPFFNSLIEKGIYVEHFYSNGNFTTNGQFGVFSGLAPSFKQNILLNQPDLKFMGLPAVMKKHGYHTLFMHGYHDLDFGGGKQFLFRAGFEEVKQMDEEFITDEDRQYIWGWGLQDDKIYEKFFSYLDRKKAKNQFNKPLFASIGTMSHHHDFRSYPKNRPLIYPNASTGDEHFSNSMFLADEYLKTFFHELKQRDYLKNSMVIIVGDHGFPSAGISIAVNGGFIYSGFSEELYRTPFLMLYDHLIPKRKKNAYAHTDIAPTILDFVGIKELVHFPGTSILSENEQHLFHLIQPFDGSYISSVIHPYKHVFHEQTGDEFIYNVERDPEETNDILEDIRAENPKMLERLQGGLKKAYIHQKLIDEDRIWPY